MTKYIVSFLSRIDVEVEVKKKAEALKRAQFAYKLSPEKYDRKAIQKVKVKRKRGANGEL